MTKATKEEFYGTKKQIKVLDVDVDNTGPQKQGAGGSSAPPPPKKDILSVCPFFRGAPEMPFLKEVTKTFMKTNIIYEQN